MVIQYISLVVLRNNCAPGFLPFSAAGDSKENNSDGGVCAEGREGYVAVFGGDAAIDSDRGYGGVVEAGLDEVEGSCPGGEDDALNVSWLVTASHICCISPLFRASAPQLLTERLNFRRKFVMVHGILRNRGSRRTKNTIRRDHDRYA